MSKDYPLILAIDTATGCSTVALTRGTIVDGAVLACLSYSSKVTHSIRLIGLVDTIFRETQVDWSMLGGIGIGLGPGSFTGLRIGMATAKGFAAASKKKLLGVSTLDGLASSCASAKRICAVMDARKKQVYTAFYRRNNKGLIVRESEIRAIAPERLVTDIEEPVVMVGDGVMAYHDFWLKELGTLVEIAPFHLHSPSAAAIGLLSGELLQNDVTLDVASASPLYVRASDAELSLIRKKGL
jgi:tRNA threonylcarbamoyladenosine biosynthesis protein TsaB